MKRAFTLIELLIVIAIIAILALIAIPNFLEAQVRAKVSRVTADMRSVATALESYRVDYPSYPFNNQKHARGSSSWDRGGIFQCWGLSTPIAYLSSTAIADPFGTDKAYDELGKLEDIPGHHSLHYINIRLHRDGQKQRHFADWLVFSLGPDYVKGPDARNGSKWNVSQYAGAGSILVETDRLNTFRYDPTNGTISNGDILRFQGY